MVLTRPSNVGRLERLIAHVVVGRDVQDVATRLGVAVSEHPLSMTSMGLTLPPARVVLRKGMPKYIKNRVLGHELGHVLVARGRCPWVVSATEESFCDDFADALLAALARGRSSFVAANAPVSTPLSTLAG